jgi:HAD superfamily hydrolase (TIGR01509 family)
MTTRPTSTEGSVIFDVGGVVFGPLVGLHSRGAIADRLGIDVNELHALFRGPASVETSMGGAPFDTGAMIPVAEKRLKELLGERARDVAEELVAVYRSGVPERLNHDVYAVLTKLKAAGLKIGILSNGPSDAAAHEWLRHSGMVDATVLSGADGVGKPSRQAFQLILDRLDSTADRSWFIDDDASHVEAARNLGFTGIHFRGDAGELERDLRASGLAW